MGFLGNTFRKIKGGLEKTRKLLNTPVSQLFVFSRKLDDAFISEMEEVLITADIGVTTAMRIIEDVRFKYKHKEIMEVAQVYDYLKATLKKQFAGLARDVKLAPSGPTVILIAGVNGTGKTTSVAKLAAHFRAAGKKVILGAGDTFRAAAIEQLTIWSSRLGVEIIKHQMNADPAAVAYDAVEAAVARKADVLLIDTAGRLHTKQNLMQELGKIRKVIQKKLPEAPHETFLVLDATTGQNAINQAKSFSEVLNVTGLVLAKLDGTAKGGVVVAIEEQLRLPVKFVGVGEKLEDLEVFDPDSFVEALLELDRSPQEAPKG
ncbi:MAG: signal recognition particle-docking protein FtsY [Planctomycetes bacterium]|nr:signal recognition particle-docking protein FtsY [Planctomycetota bacterium]